MPNSINLNDQGIAYFDGVYTFTGVDGSTAGKVLTSNGTGVVPSFQPVSSSGAVTTLTGDTGSATGANITLYADNASRNSGSSVSFDNSGSTSTFNVTIPILLNTFIGLNSGTLTATGTENTSLGSTALGSVTTGVFNSAVGSRSLANLVGGISNTAMGLASLFANVSGQDNSAFGEECLTNNLSNFNTSVGSKSLKGSGAGGGQLNSALGYGAGTNIDTAANSTFVGAIAGTLITTGQFNDAFGYNALSALLSGSYNTCIGNGSGSILASNESSNIYLNNTGTLGDNNTLRIGMQGSGNQQQNKAYIAGIAQVATSNSEMVTIDTTTGQLGSVPNSAASPLTCFSLVEDFMSNLSAGWNVSNITQANGLSTAGHPGTIGTTAQSSGFRYIFYGSTSSLPGQMYLGGGVIRYNWIVNIATLSTGSVGYILAVGLGDFGTTATPTNGVYFSYSDTINSGNWTINAMDASTPTSTDSGVAATTGWHNLGCVINAGGTSAEFFVDSVSIGTVATNLPLANPVRPELMVQWLVGSIAASNIMIDLFYLDQTLTTAR